MSDHTPSQQQRNGEHVLHCFGDNAVTYGTKVNAADLKFEIVLEADKVVRLINPSSDPRVSWQRIRNHCHIDWGDGTVVKWYARVINSGRFNRGSEFIPQHEYKNANVGDRFTITVKCREPLVPIYCRLEKMWGELPEDIYRVKSSPEADDDCGLFGECYHRDYPELSLLNKHRKTLHTVGPDLLVNWRNTDMTNMFSYFIALREVPVGFFRTVMGNVLSYENCFKGCDSLEKVDPELLGLSNNVVKVTDSMFESCLSLKNTIYLQNSESIVSVKAMYKDCWKLNLCDERLFNWCPNIVHADRIFMNDTMLNTLGPKVLKFSLNMETISEACRNTGMTETYISIGKMTKLYNAERMYYDCMKLGTITEGFFQNMGINASRTVNIDRIFMRAGDRTNGCVVPSGLCQPLGNVSKLKDECLLWFFNFSWRGNGLPSDLFRDTFKDGPGRSKFLAHDIIAYARFPQATEIELNNKILTGNQENLISLYDIYQGFGSKSDYDAGLDGTGPWNDDETETSDRTPIAYFNREMFSNCTNLESVQRGFGNIRIEFKFYEDIFKENKKLNNFSELFKKSIYKFNKFPIDYIVRTTSDDSDIDLTDMYANSNIRVYRPIHWSATRNVRYNMKDIVLNDSEKPSVPVEFMLDGRNQADPDYSFEYFPRGLEYAVQTHVDNGNKVTLCMETAGEMETALTSARIDWGDGNIESWFPTSKAEELTHNYGKSGYFKIKILSEKTPYFIKQQEADRAVTSQNPVLEIRGEYPYGCLDTYSGIRMTRYMKVSFVDQSVWRISTSSSNGFQGALYWGNYGLEYHPYMLKYCSNIGNAPLIDIKHINKLKHGRSEANFTSGVSYIPPRLYENCVNAKDWFGAINTYANMIPDDIFPVHLLREDEPTFKYMGGYHGGDGDVHDLKHKFHLKTSMYRDWMLKDIQNRDQSDLYLSYPILPYGQAWIQTLPYNYPLYEKLTFVIRDTTIAGLGLERLAAGNIGEIRIEIFTDERIIDKKITINNDTDLSGCIGDITGELNVINIYSRVPLWLSNKNIIKEVRGVIPECNLGRTFKELAPNVERISETLFYRLTNRSFDNMFKDCSKLEQIPQRLFLCNTKAESFVSCFENCVLLDRIPDYFLMCYDRDIDCSRMFAGCIGIKHIYRPISDSVLGRVTVTDMFKGCKTRNFDLAVNMDNQALDGVWFKGVAGLASEPVLPGWQRATVEVPTCYTQFNLEDISQITDADIQRMADAIYIWNPLDRVTHETRITNPKAISKALDYRLYSFGSYRTKSLSLNMNDFCELMRYTYNVTEILFDKLPPSTASTKGQPVFRDEKVIADKRFCFWLDNLRSVPGLFRYATLYTPFHTSFMKMNERLTDCSYMFDECYFKHIEDTDQGAVLGKDHAGALYLGSKGVLMDLNMDVLLDRNIELLTYATQMFNGVEGNFNGDKLHLGTCDPSGLFCMFGNVRIITPNNVILDPKLGYPFTMYTFENVLNNPNLGRHGNYAFRIHTMSFFFGNKKIKDDNGLMKKLLSFKHYKENDGERIQAIYIWTSLENIDDDCFTTLDPSVKVSIRDIFPGTNIKRLPQINHLVQLRSTWHLFAYCKGFTSVVIPENYIKSDYIDGEVELEGMFAQTNLRVENQFIDITSTATFNVKASLDGCISTIGDDPEIFLGIKYNTDPANHSLVNAEGIVKDAFIQTITTMIPNKEVHIEYVGDHTTSIKPVVDFEIDWGDGSVHYESNSTVDFATLRHTYADAGTYKVQIRCNEFFTYADTAGTPDLVTDSVGQFKAGDATEVLKADNDLGLGKYFGNSVKEFAPNLFDSLDNCDQITELNNLFSGQTLMRHIPQGVFKPFVNLSKLMNTFGACGSITGIPNDIYKYNTKLTLLALNFQGTGITAIPGDLYTNNPMMDHIELEFIGCNSLTTSGIPSTLFDPLVNLTFLASPFALSPNVVVEDDDRWNNMLKNDSIIHLNGFCMELSMKSFPSKLISRLTNLVECIHIFNVSDPSKFSNDPDIDMIPDEFFANNPLLESIDGCFNGRKNIKGVSSNIFKNNPKLHTFLNAFANTGLREIPKYIISDVQTASEIDCGLMFANCTDVKPMENEPISQHATRIVNTEYMLKGVHSVYCEPEIFTGVHTKYGYNSKYIWDTKPIIYNLRWYEDVEVPNYGLHPLFQWQVDNFEPIYIEKITVFNSTLGKTHEWFLNRVFTSLDDLRSYVIDIQSSQIGVRRNDDFSTIIYSNKPLILEFDKAYDYWVGSNQTIPTIKVFNEDKYNMDQFLTIKDPKFTWPHELHNYFGGNEKKKLTLGTLNLRSYSYSENSGYGAILYNDSFDECVNVTNVDLLFSGMKYNLATSSELSITQIMPNFSNMKELRSIASVFKDSTFYDYGNVVQPDDPTVAKWEPFKDLHKINYFVYLYRNNNLNKLFQLDFGTEDGVKSIGGMFEVCNFNFKIPYNYFDSMKKVSPIGHVNVDVDPNDDNYEYRAKCFDMWYMLASNQITSIVDDEDRVLMSEWNPDVPEDVNIYMVGLFNSNVNIPSIERVRFINGLCVIKNKTYNSLNMSILDLINHNDNGKDASEFLVNGKLLNITANTKEVILAGLLQDVSLINIPARSVVLPDSATEINITDMFKNCYCHPDVVDISEVFVYNGSANIDYASSGLKLAEKKKS